MNWAYDPMAQSEDGQIKVIMGRVKEEEINIVRDSPKYVDRKSTRLNSSHVVTSRMPSSA